MTSSHYGRSRRGALGLDVVVVETDALAGHLVYTRCRYRSAVDAKGSPSDVVHQDEYDVGFLGCGYAASVLCLQRRQGQPKNCANGRKSKGHFSCPICHVSHRFLQSSIRFPQVEFKKADTEKTPHGGTKITLGRPVLLYFSGPLAL